MPDEGRELPGVKGGASVPKEDFDKSAFLRQFGEDKPNPHPSTEERSGDGSAQIKTAMVVTSAPEALVPAVPPVEPKAEVPLIDPVITPGAAEITPPAPAAQAVLPPETIPSVAAEPPVAAEVIPTVAQAPSAAPGTVPEIAPASAEPAVIPTETPVSSVIPVVEKKSFFQRIMGLFGSRSKTPPVQEIVKTAGKVEEAAVKAPDQVISQPANQ